MDQICVRPHLALTDVVCPSQVHTVAGLSTKIQTADKGSARDRHGIDNIAVTALWLQSTLDQEVCTIAVVVSGLIGSWTGRRRLCHSRCGSGGHHTRAAGCDRASSAVCDLR